MEALTASARSAGRIDQLRTEGSADLAAAGVGTPRLDTEVLLAAAFGTDRAGLYGRGRDAISPRCEADFRAMLARRIAREPLAYIIGRQEFWSLDFLVTPDVLIPRPETELLVELTLSLWMWPGVVATAAGDGAETPEALPRARPRQDPASPDPNLRLCDLGTGSGCLAVALAHELPGSEVWALDISPAALRVAAANAQQHGVAHRIRFLESDLFASVGAQRFDAIISNPPYVCATERERLQLEVRCEPWLGLNGGGTGLAVIQRVLDAASKHLVDGGWLLMEIGADQEAAVTALACAAQLRHVSVRRDYAGLPRVLVARR